MVIILDSRTTTFLTQIMRFGDRNSRLHSTEPVKPATHGLRIDARLRDAFYLNVNGMH